MLNVFALMYLVCRYVSYNTHKCIWNYWYVYIDIIIDLYYGPILIQHGTGEYYNDRGE